MNSADFGRGPSIAEKVDVGRAAADGRTPTFGAKKVKEPFIIMCRPFTGSHAASGLLNRLIVTQIIVNVVLIVM